MNTLKLNRVTLSPAIWTTISSVGIHPQRPNPDHDRLIRQADYKTGSISPIDAGELNAIVRYFGPATVAEVGTYIGNSTRAIVSGMSGGVIYTCDAANDIKLLPMYGATIEQFPKKTSTEMFGELIKRQVKPDLFYIDGRLSSEDPNLMRELNPGSIVVLDDFEGVEKGVVNAGLLLSNAFSNHLLVYPRSGGKTAILMPIEMLHLTAQ